MHAHLRRLLRSVFYTFVLLFAGCFVAVVVTMYVYLSQPLHLSSAFELTVEPGDTFSEIATDLSMRGVLLHPEAFVLFAATRRGVLNTGHYQLLPDMTAYQCFQLLTGGRVMTYRITFVPGERFAHIIMQLHANPHLFHDLAAMTEAQVSEQLQLTTANAEGEFLANTYFFTEGTMESQILSRAHHAMVLVLQEEWDTRDPRVPLTTPYEALVLASIVERETVFRDEMPVVAGVFYNRLKHGMRLQADSTVSVAANKAFYLPITKEDLANLNPYNTYRFGGLPPSPIALPSRAALYAVLHPARTSYFYFVAKGDGRSVFSSNYRAHTRAVNRYLRKANG